MLFLLESTPLVSATVIFSAAIDVGGISAAISYAAKVVVLFFTGEWEFSFLGDGRKAD